MFTAISKQTHCAWEKQKQGEQQDGQQDRFLQWGNKNNLNLMVTVSSPKTTINLVIKLIEQRSD